MKIIENATEYVAKCQKCSKEFEMNEQGYERDGKIFCSKCGNLKTIKIVKVPIVEPKKKKNTFTSKVVLEDEIDHPDII